MIRMILILSLFASVAKAANVHTSQPHEISRLVFFSKEESIYPEWQGITQVMFDNINWSSGSCNTKSVGVRGEDTHLISGLLSAKASGTKIRVYADDTLKVKSDYCYLRAISY